MYKYSKIVIYAVAVLVLAGIMLMSACGQIEDVKADNASDTAGAEAENEVGTKPDAAEDKIDYPFPQSIENWRLMLYTENTAEGKNTFIFRLYDEDKNLMQEFPCEIEARELTFRFDKNLCDSWPGLAVFPADVEETYGLLYTFDYDKDRFDEAPIEIPRYEEIISSHTILVTDRQEDAEIKTIFTIDKDLREAVELRIWILSWNSDDGGTAELYIWDCIEQAEIYNGVLYDGEVQWKALGKLADDAYFQELFFKDLKYPWAWAPLSDGTIPTVKYTFNSETDWHIENIDYESKEALLEDCGFQDAELFYQYYDRFGNIELELYFDERAGKGCGFQYVHGFNDELEKVFCCCGFIFEGTSTDEWVNDAFSLMVSGGRDAEGYEDVTQVTYQYTDDGKISSYEVRGLTEDTELRWWEGMEVKDDFLLSIDWVYRSDGTLYRKYYSHNSRVFWTSGQSQRTYYDELGRAVYRDEYITHGSHVYYYIYDGDRMKPKYCLLLDEDGGYSAPSMIVYS